MFKLETLTGIYTWDHDDICEVSHTADCSPGPQFSPLPITLPFAM